MDLVDLTCVCSDMGSCWIWMIYFVTVTWTEWKLKQIEELVLVLLSFYSERKKINEKKVKKHKRFSQSWLNSWNYHRVGFCIPESDSEVVYADHRSEKILLLIAGE